VVLSGLRVLVADDNATNRRILQAMLTGLGLQVTLAEDGRQALSRYRPGGFDLLLLDISMPELDGPAALAAMRAQDGMAGAPSPPAVAVTAHAMAHQIAEILEAGFAGHLAKPFSKAGLARVLADCLRDGAHPLAAAPARA
jgi:CheY-like chemotaxis protein